MKPSSKLIVSSGAEGYQVTGPNREIYWPDAQAGAFSLTEVQFPVFIKPKPTSAGS